METVREVKDGMMTRVEYEAIAAHSKSIGCLCFKLLNFDIQEDWEPVHIQILFEADNE